MRATAVASVCRVFVVFLLLLFIVAVVVVENEAL